MISILIFTLSLRHKSYFSIQPAVDESESIVFDLVTSWYTFFLVSYRYYNLTEYHPSEERFPLPEVVHQTRRLVQVAENGYKAGHAVDGNDECMESKICW